MGFNNHSLPMNLRISIGGDTLRENLALSLLTARCKGFYYKDCWLFPTDGSRGNPIRSRGHSTRATPSVNTFVFLTVLGGIAVIATFLWGFLAKPNTPAKATMEGRHKLFGLAVALTILLALMAR